MFIRREVPYGWVDFFSIIKAGNVLKDPEKKEILEEEVEALTKEGKTMEDIARMKVQQRNQERINSYLKANNTKGFESMKERNLQEYGREEGPTPEQLFLKYGSWEEVIFGRVNWRRIDFSILLQLTQCVPKISRSRADDLLAEYTAITG